MLVHAATERLSRAAANLRGVLEYIEVPGSMIDQLTPVAIIRRAADIPSRACYTDFR